MFMKVAKHYMPLIISYLGLALSNKKDITKISQIRITKGLTSTS